MKDIFMLCNAHLDPVWLWTWEEGAAEALSTFRCAAEFCEEFDGFVFNHNESILYEWVEEYEPELMERIEKLVKAGKWQIMGGWYLQSDCTMLSGESFIRQISYGKNYFRDKFDVDVEDAINFDPFGHTRGLVQILKKTGYRSYTYTRPHGDSGDFIWRGFDGSEIIAHKVFGWYNTLKGRAVERINSALESIGDREKCLLLWGVGNHGGGPSRIDIQNINAFIKENPQYNVKHSSCKEYFNTVSKEGLNIVEKSLGPSMVGCYSSMVRIKQANRRVENKLELCKRMSAHAGLEADKDMLEKAEKALMLAQFHDCLPGSMIKRGEEATLKSLGLAEEVCDKLTARAFFKLCDGQKRCKDGEIPVLVYNPMPYAIERDIEVEFQLSDQNWNENEYTIARVRDENGSYLLTQNEKEDCTFNLDWRKKVVFRSKLKPMSVNRFDCELTVMTGYNRIEKADEDQEYLLFDNGNMSVKISKKTGLIDEYIVHGKKILNPSSAVINVYSDNEDPWGMNQDEFKDKIDKFALMSDEAANEFRGYPDEKLGNINIIENGAVRTKVQALFSYKKSIAIITYTIPKYDIYIDMDITLYSNDTNKLYKLSFDTAVENASFAGQTAFGTDELPMAEAEATFHKWCGLVAEDQSLCIINNGVYAGSANKNILNITLLRTPVYSAHPIENRQRAPHDRMLEHIDMGERSFRFRITTEKNINSEAESFNMPPYTLSFFPSGKGERKEDIFEIGSKDIILSTLSNKDGKLLLRLFNSADKEVKTFYKLKGKPYDVQFTPFEVKTFVFENNMAIKTDMLGNKL